MLICPRKLIEFNVNNTCSAIIKGDNKSIEDGRITHMNNVLDIKEVCFKYYTSIIKVKLYLAINT